MWQTFILLILIGAGSGALYATNHKTPAPKSVVAATANPAAVLSNGTNCINLGNSTPTCPSAKQPAATAPMPTSSASSTYKGESCSQAEATLGPILNSGVAELWDIWSGSTYYTPAEINYEYNQSAQTEYNSYIQSMADVGCTPQLPSPLKYPATAPTGFGSTSTPPVAPTCNQTLQTDYEQEYQSQVQEDQEKANQQYQSLLAQLNAAGAGESSAVQEGEQIIQNQLNQELGSLKSTLNDELISIDCPTV